ncbi:MAG TPA: bifunctional riboflavin kinase/FAD synthetase [Prolixibacteraceae bacterium]|nr:bifunctional riboflavin kinase/FAD synthetase [Prolixibacteraceae bacterium]
MQIHYNLDNFKAVNPVVTIGTFDGVHLGHREVISELKRISGISGGESVVFTFEPHPRIVIAPQEDSLRLLSTKNEKINLMEKMGIDHLVIYPFTVDFSKLSYNEFVRNILVGKMNISSLVVGYDHRFGQGRKGDFSSLELLSKELNFKVEQLSQLLVDSKVVSSTKIRIALEAGDVSKANHFLGYRYSLSGKVIEGKQLGRKLGFPTANIETLDNHKLVPGDGVYAVFVQTGEKIYKGMLNVGFRPTVNYNADHKSIEVHIFDFDSDIYNSEITLNFVMKIRDEQKFAGIVELHKQLVKDRIFALNVLSSEVLEQI